MKATSTRKAIVCILVIGLTASYAAAQGDLTPPPGVPAPTMKTLDQVEARTPISSIPFTITESGSYYLTMNLTAAAAYNGITVSASDVTIDLNGFTLDGYSTGNHGIIQGSGHSNLHVFNGTVKNWSYDGIQLEEGGIVNQCVARGNGDDGIQIGNGSVVDGCIVTANYYGIYVINDNCRVAACTVNQNRGEGILIAGNTNVVESCIANQNTTGIFLSHDSDCNQIEGNRTIGNSSTGIFLSDTATSNFIVRNMSMKNGTPNTGNFDFGTGYNLAGNIVISPQGAGEWDNIREWIVE